MGRVNRGHGIALCLRAQRTDTRHRCGSNDTSVGLLGNVMGRVFVIGIALSLAGLLVPVPLMALELLTGAVQAYIFSALATVFIGGAIGEMPQSPETRK